ncbi:MAG TPA: aldo/keto reductase, partial [Lactobacillus sp.]|nr:aldo/keto reductase [Lactobacillus sp.]
MYHAATDRYAKMPVRHAGKTGLMLPAISLGLWQHYGNLDPFNSRRSVILDAFDHGVFHFDVANHYGNGDVDPGYGSSETLL